MEEMRSEISISVFGQVLCAPSCEALSTKSDVRKPLCLVSRAKMKKKVIVSELERALLLLGQ